VPVSEVYTTFAYRLPTAIEKMIKKTQKKRAYMLKLYQNRFDFKSGNAHGIGHLLDPRYVGKGMSIELRNRIENIIYLHRPSAGKLTSTFPQERMSKKYTVFCRPDQCSLTNSYVDDNSCLISE
jgi:hypothetical protein